MFVKSFSDIFGYHVINLALEDPVTSLKTSQILQNLWNYNLKVAIFTQSSELFLEPAGKFELNLIIGTNEDSPTINHFEIDRQKIFLMPVEYFNMNNISGNLQSNIFLYSFMAMI